ncbi:MarR family winged helix-turn-helix transcriptional regulator [Embleya sp. NPDC005575]|uniref:MarR family winged helix-turn-helix transcriptional regulator n=1 Tax=Embleya sp. NPDC005575 TaxID=3156892 RepID=UPI0033A44791
MSRAPESSTDEAGRAEPAGRADAASATSRAVAEGLVGVLPALIRALERRSDRELPSPKPSEGERALLRLVAERDGITVRQAAEALLMKPNNVSALVSKLVGKGLLERMPDPADKRVAHLHSTPAARSRSNAVDALLADVVHEGLTELGTDQVAAIGAAIAGLRALTEAVHAGAG